MNSILQDLAHPPTRHAMFVHLPIVLAMLGIPLTLMTAVLPKNLTLRMMSIVLYAGLIVAAFVTVNSGEGAEGALGAISDQANQILNQHEDKAERVWLFGALVLVLLLISLFKHSKVRPIAAWLAFVTGIVSFWWVGQTANLGGTLVYRQGVGVPQPTMTATAPQPVASTQISGDGAALFEHTIWPALAENCTKCHNATRAADGKSGKLDQTSLKALLKGGRSGPAIVPGKPEESLLISRVKAADPDERMPPQPREPLTPEQIGALEQWIREGAVWPADAK